MPEDVLRLFHEPARKWFADTFGRPTRVQEEAWPAIAAGKHVLVSAPTGTGKTLSAFLIFIDRLNALAREGKLKPELYLIYVSPLKSLAGDIRENLRRPLEGIECEGREPLRVAVRTGDTPQKERRMMVKQPPHILIITPESLYLMLTSGSGRAVLRTARSIILDELHALIDTKRGAHLMLSVARLDRLTGGRLSRIGLSATIEPLSLAAEYLAPEPAVICAPAMEKKVRIEVTGTAPASGRRKDPVWEELGTAVYQRCACCKSVIAFCEGRRYAEKLAYYVNERGGDGFARVHHGSLSRQQREEAENDLRAGRLRLLCATSSMELGIDVGDVELVIQIGCPRTISGTMQRLGRAGHKPGEVSVMYMYPRTAPESVFCGMTAAAAVRGGVEHARPPRLCLDVLAQHLVSMAAAEEYGVDDVMDILTRAYPFREVTREDVKDVLAMLAGDYEHSREIPVRPRLLYDRIHERVSGDAYSRLLAVSAGGTIPDKGLYTAKTEDGVKLGELDEEFVYESRIGDKFMLGSFGWRIVRQDRDSVIVTRAPAEGARLPFWKGETGGRSLRTSLAFGKIAASLEQAERDGRLLEELSALGLDEAAAANAAGFLRRQIEATGGLPDDKTILIEHFKDSSGCHQAMVHALFGRRVNAPLSLLARYAAGQETGLELGCVDEEDGFLIYPYGDGSLPEGILRLIDPGRAREVLETLLPLTPVFSMSFRYNAARALMMGMRQGGRQPLWMQRLRSTQMLSSLIGEKNHPLIRETKRECMEDQWDIDGALFILGQLRAGLIRVREIYTDVPSPLSLPFQWQAEAAEMYEYTPTTHKISGAVYQELEQSEKLRPSGEELSRRWERKKQPENERQLHALLVMEGDLTAGELPAPVEWLESLAEEGLALYKEPGLWIAAEHEEEYERALEEDEEAAWLHIIRRMLYYRGGQTAEEIRLRYCLLEQRTQELLDKLLLSGSVMRDGEVYYHGRLYEQARERYVRSRREQAATRPAENYAALIAGTVRIHAPAEEQLQAVMEQYCGRIFPVGQWEELLLAGRVGDYTPNLLDRLLARGDYFWRMTPEGGLCFCRYEDIDWEAPVLEPVLEGDELLVYTQLKRRGACFLKLLTGIPKQKSAQEVLLGLAQKGLVCADSFVPVRQLKNKDKIKKSAARARVNARVQLLSAGRWDIARPVAKKSREEWLQMFLDECRVLSQETFRKAMLQASGSPYLEEAFGWKEALWILRIWEYTGRIRRGYFVEGLSGAQFIKSGEYDAVTAALGLIEESVVWLNASDPAQLWGKVLKQPEERAFMNVPGTAVALAGGRPAAVFERQGAALKIYEEKVFPGALSEFVRDFRKGFLYPGKKRLCVKQYPQGAGPLLKAAGFLHEMQDYVLYR